MPMARYLLATYGAFAVVGAMLYGLGIGIAVERGLRESGRNKVAFELLRKLSTGVDVLREQLRHAIPAEANQRLYADYLLTVQGDTDSSATRERRRELLKGLLFSGRVIPDSERAGPHVCSCVVGKHRSVKMSMRPANGDGGSTTTLSRHIGSYLSSLQSTATSRWAIFPQNRASSPQTCAR